jgi:hypothetical protein
MSHMVAGHSLNIYQCSQPRLSEEKNEIAQVMEMLADSHCRLLDTGRGRRHRQDSTGSRELQRNHWDIIPTVFTSWICRRFYIRPTDSSK